MEGSFTIEELEYGINVRFKAGIEVTPELLIDAVDQEVAQYPSKDRYSLWDFRGSYPSPNFGYDAMLRVIEHIEANYADKWSVKTGILVDETILFGLSRMFQTLVDGYSADIGVFKDESEARHWVSQKK